MMDADLKTFLVHGRLGDIALGQADEVVKASLGEPTDIALGGIGATIWRFGQLQLTLEHNQLVSIGIYWTSGDGQLPAAISVSGYYPTSATDLEEFRSYLEREGIAAQADADLTFGDQVCLRTDSGVLALFDDRGRHLYSIQVVQELVTR